MDTKRWLSLLFAVLLVPVLVYAQSGTRVDQLELRPKTQAMLSLPPFSTAKDGNFTFCVDCTPGSNPCSAGGPGSQAMRLGGAWTCSAEQIGNYVSLVQGTNNEIVCTQTPGKAATATISLSPTINLTNKTSFTLPNNPSPATTVFGQLAGDNNAWGVGRGALQTFDGTVASYLVAVPTSSVPLNGQVPTYQNGQFLLQAGGGGGGSGDALVSNPLSQFAVTTPSQLATVVPSNTGNGPLVFANGPVFTGNPTIPTPFTLGSTSVTTTGAELNFIAGLTGSIQAQLNAKAPLASPVFTGTGVTLPTSATPTTTVFGQIVGRTNAWAANRSTFQFFDGTANAYIVATQASDVPTNGQVPMWNNGVWTNETIPGVVTNGFSTIDAPLGTDPVATSPTDSLTLGATLPLTITGNAGTKSVNWAIADATTLAKGAVILATSGQNTANVVVQGNDARLSDTRTPTAHAVTHQHGGVDEVATATPAANAIPKAGAGGTIADGWHASTIARVTDVTTHAALTTAHGSTTANTANTIVQRDATGGISWKSIPKTVATLPTCDATSWYVHYTVTDGASPGDCETGGGTNSSECVCNVDSHWRFTGNTSASTSLQTAYSNGQTITSGANGLKFSEFNSLTKSLQICNDGDSQCGYWYVDQSGRFQFTLKAPADLFTKLYLGYAGGFMNAAEVPLFQVSETGVVSGAAQFLEKCLVVPVVDGTDNKLFTSFQQPVTIKSTWCNYEGAAPTLTAAFALEHGNGTALTHTAPVCSGPDIVASPQLVTAGGSLTAREVLRFDVTNTPNPATNNPYLLCVAYTLDTAVISGPQGTLTVLASDTFDRADSGDLGASWNVQTLQGSFTIAGNVAAPANLGGDTAEQYVSVAFPNDQWVQAKISGVGGTVAGGQGAGVGLRMSPSALTYYRVMVNRAATSNVAIYKFTAGVSTNIAFRTASWADGDILRAEVQGNTLRVYQNGIQLGASIIDSSPITSGNTGIVYSSSMSSASVNDWSAGQLN